MQSLRGTANARAPGIGATIMRAILLLLTLIFLAGALAQFFLAGLAIFDTPARWADHETVGHIVGEAAFIAWVFAAFGRVGARLIVGSLLLAILMGAQYAFVNADAAWVQALHPLNGAVLFALAIGIVVATVRLLARGRVTSSPADAEAA